MTICQFSAKFEGLATRELVIFSVHYQVETPPNWRGHQTCPAICLPLTAVPPARRMRRYGRSRTPCAGTGKRCFTAVDASLCYNPHIMFKQFQPSDLVVEMVGGEPYEYYPLGEHIVMAPGICGGRPTFKYTRLEVRVILADLKAGYSVDEVVADFHRSNLSKKAVEEALRPFTDFRSEK